MFTIVHMSAERIYTVAELLALYAPSETPDNFADFGQFGSIESVPPIGDNKPIIEQKPHRKSFTDPQDGEHVESEQRRNEPTRYNQNKQKQHNVAPKKQQAPPKKILPKDTVKVEAEFAGMDFSWGKSKPTEAPKPEPAAAPVHAPPPVPTFAPMPKNEPEPTFEWQQTRRVNPPSFDEILNEPEPQPTVKPFVPAFKPRSIHDEAPAPAPATPSVPTFAPVVPTFAPAPVVPAFAPAQAQPQTPVVPAFAPKQVEDAEPSQPQMRFDPPQRRGFNPKPYEPYIPGQAKAEERRDDFRAKQFKPYTPGQPSFDPKPAGEAKPAWAPAAAAHAPPPAPADDEFPALGAEKPREKPKEKPRVVTNEAEFPSLGAAPVHAAPKRASAWSNVKPN